MHRNGDLIWVLLVDFGNVFYGVSWWLNGFCSGGFMVAFFLDQCWRKSLNDCHQNGIIKDVKQRVEGTLVQMSDNNSWAIGFEGKKGCQNHIPALKVDFNIFDPSPPQKDGLKDQPLPNPQ